MSFAPRTLYKTDFLEVFLSLRELFDNNRVAKELDDETLAELLFIERYVSRRVAAHEIEIAREALLTDSEFYA